MSIQIVVEALGLKEQKKQGGQMIPISKVVMGAEEEAQVLEVLRSGIIAQGPKVAELEQLFSEAYGMKNVVAVNNGTTALIAALMAHNIGPGDEVITSPFTFAATLNAILYVGATPVFADISEVTYNVNPAEIEKLITSKTKAIMPVHLYGQSSNMSAISQIATQHNLTIIQDAAQAQGAQHFGNFVGSTHTATFSLYATKNMTTGEGGLISTDNDDVAQQIKILRNQGMRNRYEYVSTGNNWRLTDLQAAIGLPQLAKYSENIKKRSSNANFYNHELSGIDGLVTPTTEEGNLHVWHQYTLRLAANNSITRDEFISKLATAGIGSGSYYPRAVYDYDAFRNHPLVKNPNCPVAELVASQTFSIPVHPHLSDKDLNTVANAVKQICAGK